MSARAVKTSHEDEEEDVIEEEEKEVGSGGSELDEQQHAHAQNRVPSAPGTPPLCEEASAGTEEEDEAPHDEYGGGGGDGVDGEGEDEDEEYAYEGNVRALMLLDVRAETEELPIRSTVPFSCDKYGFAALVGSGCDVLDVRFAVGSDERGSERWFTERLAVETGVNLFVLKCGAPLRVERLPERFEDVPGRDDEEWKEEEQAEEDLGLQQQQWVRDARRPEYIVDDVSEKAKMKSRVQNDLRVPPLGAQAFGFDMFGNVPGAAAKAYTISQNTSDLGEADLDKGTTDEGDTDDNDDDDNDDVLGLARTMRQTLAWEGLVGNIDSDDDDDDAFDDAYEDFVIDDEKNEAYGYGWVQRSQLEALEHRLAFLLAQQDAQDARMRAFVADEVATVQAQLAEEQQDAYMEAEERLMDTNDALVDTMKKFRRLVAQVQDERAPSMRRIEGKIRRRFDALERMLGREDEAMAAAERRDAEIWSAAVRDVYAAVDDESKRRRETIAALVDNRST